MENDVQDPTIPVAVESPPAFFPAEASPYDGGTPPNEPQNTAAGMSGSVNALVGQARDHLAGQVTAGKDGLADQLEGLARSVHGTSEQFAGKQDWIARAIDGGAQELSSLAQALRGSDLTDLFAQVQSFARRQPGVFIGASLAAGFAVARLGKVLAADLSRDDLPTMPEVGHGG